MPSAASRLLRSGQPVRSFALFALFGLMIVCFSLLQLVASDKVETPKGRHGMVVAVSPEGAEAGKEILLKGGNAVDAAVATALAMAVTYPAAGNLGGGGFMVIHPAHGQGEPLVIDYREMAPSAASKTMYTKKDTIYSHKAVGVPGTVRGLALAHTRFGKLPWREVVAPAVEFAEKGFVLDDYMAGSLNYLVSSSAEFAETVRAFGKNGKADWRAGDRFLQPDLAKTLKCIQLDGPDAFYTGPIADLIAAEMKSGGGLITKPDLAAYRARARTPIHGTYHGYDVYAPPPPSSGGICLVEMLNILENFDLKKQGRWSPATLHLLIETMRRAYCDRAKYLGDGDFVQIPEHLTSKEYAKKLAASIDPKKATRSEDLAKEIKIGGESDTTHFSVIDGDGMAVANTYTLERSYGSHITVKGAGFLLNNEMMDFNWFPGDTRRDGQIGTSANQIAPGKRMLSSQTPTIVARDGKVVLITGSPGSRTIINTSLQILLNVLEFDMDARAAVDAPRLHHQWLPDRVRFEGMSEYSEAVAKLKTMGHIVEGTRQGDAHTIRVDPKTGAYIGAEDRRILGKASLDPAIIRDKEGK
jgi:gamma-glutamyltranspeptidase / glutathione hydrolase